MVGRAHYGAPWTAGEIAAMARGEPGRAVPYAPGELADYVLSHHEDMLSLYGVESGIRQARKHLGWYFARHAAGAPPELVRVAMTSLEPGAVRGAIANILRDFAGVPSLEAAA